LTSEEFEEILEIRVPDARYKGIKEKGRYQSWTVEYKEVTFYIRENYYKDKLLIVSTNLSALKKHKESYLLDIANEFEDKLNTIGKKESLKIKNELEKKSSKLPNKKLKLEQWLDSIC
jgi:hypothetical protein